MKYVFHINVTLKMAISLTLLALLFSFGGVGLYLWLGEMGPLAVIPGIIGLLLLLATVVIRAFKSRVLIEDGLVTVRKSVLGIPVRWRKTRLLDPMAAGLTGRPNWVVGSGGDMTNKATARMYATGYIRPLWEKLIP